MWDVSTAVYHAYRADTLPLLCRLSRFYEKLDGKEIASAGHLSARQVEFADEISELDGKLNFYMDTGFDVDAMFGTNVCTADNDDCLNVYADYDMAVGQVCGELEVDLHYADGREESRTYSLNAAEKVILLRKMDAYCQGQTGMTLKDYSAQLMAEDMASPAGPATSRLSVFRVTQEGRTDHLLTEGDAAMDVLHTAMRLRSYLLRKGNSSERFIQAIPAADYIAPEVFEDYADELRQRTGRVIAALNVDLDRGEFSTLDALNGWETYTIRDVCVAAWHANHRDGVTWEWRLDRFATQLEGKEIATPDRLADQEITPPDGPGIGLPEQTM